MALIDRIKFDGLATRNWLVYKYPGEEFVLGTQLIVGEGQVAVFFKGGQACDLFTAGTHTLSTANLPIIKNIVNIPFGGQTPFTAEIYFVNKTTKLDMNWGTVDPIQVIDPKYKTKLRIRGFGQFGIRIIDFRLFLTELIGAMGSSEVISFEKIMKFFKGLLMTKVKTIIADAIINKGISALEITAKLEEISNFGMEKVTSEFQRFGLQVVNFFVESINFPDEDFETINKILTERAAFDIIGDNRYVSKRSFDVLETMAGNEGTLGTLAGAGVGLGAGIGMGSALTGVAPVLHPTAAAEQSNLKTQTQSLICNMCKNDNPVGSVFCLECGNKLILNVTCSGCGKEISQQQKFCNYCGIPVITKKICTECGTEVSIDSKFCGKCGKSI